MNIAEGVTPDLKKTGTIEERDYENDMMKVYELNADCETVTIEFTFFHIEDAFDGDVYDVLKIGEKSYYGKKDPFTVKSTHAFSFVHESGENSK